MAIKSLTDINSAFEDGRWHTQRFQKNLGQAHSLHWCDPTFSSGQPPYDARVGVPLQFTPCVAQKNDAIWFPGIAAGMDRHLVSVSMSLFQNTFNGPASIYGFDLLGFYPLIDGDSIETQTMDNSAPLPRYTSGEGVQLVVINHIAPPTQAGACVIDYIDSDGNSRTSTVTITADANLVCGNMGSAGTWGNVGISLGNGSRGVRSVTSVRHTAAPGGLHCIYLIKPLFTAVLGDNGVAIEKEFVTKNGFNCPKVLDGAWLGWFDRIGSGTNRQTSCFGHFSFVWG